MILLSMFARFDVGTLIMIVAAVAIVLGIVFFSDIKGAALKSFGSGDSCATIG
jgi:hypothetical protein